MTEPITIELAGAMELGEQEGGFDSDDIRIGNDYLDVAIARALGYRQGGRRGPCVNEIVGQCKLTLMIWPSEKRGALTDDSPSPAQP